MIPQENKDGARRRTDPWKSIRFSSGGTGNGFAFRAGEVVVDDDAVELALRLGGKGAVAHEIGDPKNDLPSFVRGCVARADPDRRFVLEPNARAVRGVFDPCERGAEVLLDVDGQRA